MAARATAAAAAVAPASRSAGRRAARPATRPATPPTVRTSPARRKVQRPALEVVPRKGRAARMAVVLGAVLFSVLFAVTAFQTRLAQHQMELDRTDDQITVERERYDQLRLQRAELLAPQRLMAEAAALGMVPGEATEFVSVSARTVAEVAVSAAGVPDRARRRGTTPLEQYGEIKATVDGAG